MIRLYDILFSLIGMLLCIPILIIISAAVVIESGFPILYKQKRVGLYGSVFSICKFRSMFRNSDKMGLITIGGRDSRVTNVGYIIRKYKLDELPQLYNVLCGDMSFVGPRPEVEKYVDLYSDTQRQVLSVKPGITDYASIIYSNENELLENVDNPDSYYTNVIMPRKIRLNLIYVNNRTICNYFKIIVLTIGKVLK